MKNLEEKLGYSFKNKALLQKALTHSSVSSGVCDNYERLEFLGDRVLGLSVAALLYDIFPNEPEGNLSQRFTALVNKDAVAQVAKSLGLDEKMIVLGEEIRENENVLCDVCEALIGAIFKDSGCDEAVKFVNEHWKELIDKNLAPPKDKKTTLQEISHIKGLGAPQYKIVERTGSEHEPTFYIAVSLKGVEAQIGEGKNKKLAEFDAAGKMLKRIGYEQ